MTAIIERELNFTGYGSLRPFRYIYRVLIDGVEVRGWGSGLGETERVAKRKGATKIVRAWEAAKANA